MTDRLRAEVETVKRALGTHDRLRALVYPSPDPPRSESSEEAILGELRTGAPELLAWRIYDHCAAFTRLYAIYQRFVEDLIAEWLQQLPDLYQRYDDLPDNIRRSYRRGLAYVLDRLGADRYGHLAESGLARGFFESVTGVVPYRLLTEAFLIDEQNLRHDVLNALCSRVGLDHTWQWIARHARVQEFLDEVRGSTSTAESELRNLVHFRNIAAHGAVEEVVATEEIATISDFIILLGEVLAEFLMLQAVERRLFIGTASRVGVVSRRFRDRVVGVRMQDAVINIGDRVVVLRSGSCFFATVESIQVNNISFDNLHASEGDMVGLRLSREVGDRAAIIRLP